MKKFILLFVFIAFNTINAYSCTTFVLKSQNELIFGRNLDWYSDNGIVVINKRNVLKNSLVFSPDKPIQWTSKYGSISFNQFGKEFPFGGINEKGLIIEIMVAPAEYPLKDERPAVNELQWVQYQLDNSQSIDDVVNSDKLLIISAISQELHFLICDRLGNSAVIEFKNNKMLVYRDYELPIPVLENEVYSNSLENYNNNISCRFTTAANMIKNYYPQKDNSIVDYSFQILDSVALSGSWSIVYDVKNMKIHFKTQTNHHIQIIDFTKFNFDCKSENLIYNLAENYEGIIDKFFISFNPKVNKDIIQKALKSNKLNLAKEVESRFFKYYQECVCE
jgi:choloylglycine hydrolase